MKCLTLAALAALATISLALFGGRAGPSLSLGGAALAHGDADWIRRGQHRNAAGEWCCGEGDCFVVRGVQIVGVPAPGYRLPSGEFVPQAEAQPSPDGQF
jgi:hypothetical protein